MALAEQILPNFSERMRRFAAYFQRLVVKKTGELERSIAVEVVGSGHFIHIRVRFRIYALILYHMSKTGYRQKRKKGGYVQGSRRYIGANRISKTSPLQKNPKQYQVPIEALFTLRDDIGHIAQALVAQKTVEELTQILSE
jgi:hypothetical protein